METVLRRVPVLRNFASTLSVSAAAKRGDGVATATCQGEVAGEASLGAGAAGGAASSWAGDGTARGTREAVETTHAPPGDAGITVVGGGLLGSSIAAWLLLLGERVSLVDSNMEEAVSKVRANLRQADQALRARWPSWEHVQPPLDALSTFRSGDLVDAVQRSWLVIEAVPDDLEIKKKVFGATAQANPGAVLVSNTMALDPTTIAASLNLREGSIFRMRFLYPVAFIPFVEITETRGAEAAIAQVKQWLTSCGMLPFASDRRLKISYHEKDQVQDYFVRKLAPRVLPGLTVETSGDASPGWVMDDAFQTAPACIICMEAEPTVMSVGACTHICMCQACSLDYMKNSCSSRRPNCPICRQFVQPAVILH